MNHHLYPLKRIILSITVLLFTCLLTVKSTAQTGSGWEWASTSGVANAGKFMRDITTDAAGNVYATGSYNDSLTLGATTLTGTPAGYNHAFVVKYNSLGNVLWLTQYNNGKGGIEQKGSVIDLDANGNIYIGGTDNGTAGGVGTGFVLKLDNNGNILWSKVLNLYEVIGINTGPDGNPIVIETTPGKRNIYKLNKTDGAIIWTVENTGSSIPVDNHNSYSNFLDSKGNIYYNIGSTPFGGSYTTEVLAGQTFINPGYTSYFVSLNNSGSFRWVDSVSNMQKGTTTVAKDGKIYMVLAAGASSGGLGGTHQPLTSRNAYYELDSLGKVTYNQVAYPYPGYTGTKLILKDNSLYTTTGLVGGTPVTVSFGDYSFAAPAANTSALTIIVKYDAVTHNVVWANSFEATGYTYNAGGALALNITNAGKIVVGGYYLATINFGAIVKTVTRSYTQIPYDCFIAQFDGSKVALPPVTTWTGAANNKDWNDANNWNNGVPNAVKTIIPGGLSSYPNNITSAVKVSKLQVDAGVTIALPLAISITGGIINNGTIELTEAGFFYGGFNTGQTLVSGTGKIAIKNSGLYYFGLKTLDNSLEINCGGTLISFGGTINGSLFLTSGIYSGNIHLANPNAIITSSADSYVAGNINRSVNASGNYNFPVGSSTRYSSVTIQLNNISGPTNITASFTNTIDGIAPNTTAGSQKVTQLLDAGIWSLTPDIALSAGNYSITLQGTGFTNQVADASQYVVVKRANAADSWGFYGDNGTAIQSSGIITATAGNIAGFSNFAIGIASGPVATTLPVKLLSFSAEKRNNTVLLQWQTTAELNNDHFDIQHSTDGKNWHTAGHVSAANTQSSSYSFVHKTPVAGANYYRLQQVDKDGRKTISHTLKLIFDNTNSNLRVYPNAVTANNFTIDMGKEINSPVNYTLYTINGTSIQTGTIHTRYQQVYFRGAATAGIYILKTYDGRQITIEKK